MGGDGEPRDGFVSLPWGEPADGALLSGEPLEDFIGRELARTQALYASIYSPLAGPYRESPPMAVGGLSRTQ